MHGDKPDGKKKWQEVVWKKHSYNERTVIKSGSYLNCFCPHCDANLMKDHMIHLETVNEDGQTGWVELSPYLNSFEHVSDIRLPENHEVADLKCESCKASLKVEGRTCERGGAHVACVMIGISSARVPFYFCMCEGCHWHEIDSDDEHLIILDESMEW